MFLPDLALRGPSPTESLENFYSCAIPMWIFDRSTLALLEINQAAIRQYGYTRAEFLKLTPVDMRPSEDIPKFLRSAFRLHKVGADGEVWRHRRKDGSVFYASIIRRDILFDGHTAEIVSATLVRAASQR